MEPLRAVRGPVVKSDQGVCMAAQLSDDARVDGRRRMRWGGVRRCCGGEQARLGVVISGLVVE